MPDCRSLPRHSVDTSISACRTQTDSQKIESEVPMDRGSLTGIVVGCWVELRSKLTVRFESRIQHWCSCLRGRTFCCGAKIALKCDQNPLQELPPRYSSSELRNCRSVFSIRSLRQPLSSPAASFCGRDLSDAAPAVEPHRSCCHSPDGYCDE